MGKLKLVSRDIDNPVREQSEAHRCVRVQRYLGFPVLVRSLRRCELALEILRARFSHLRCAPFIHSLAPGHSPWSPIAWYLGISRTFACPSARPRDRPTSLSLSHVTP